MNNWAVYLAVENKSIFLAISDGLIFTFERNQFFMYYLWKMFLHLGFFEKKFKPLSADPTKRSKHTRVCLPNLWGWRIKGSDAIDL